jgi:hypothetical protein
MSSLYEMDFDSWIQEQVNLLESKEYEHIDFDNIIEEMKSMGKSDRRALCNQMIRLLMHLLKYKYQPEKQEYGSSWTYSIRDSRREINAILQDSPNLKNFLTINYRGIYLKAVREASEETGIPIDMFEKNCLWTLEEVLG